MNKRQQKKHAKIMQSWAAMTQAARRLAADMECWSRLSWKPTTAREHHREGLTRQDRADA
jgi:hypothetical protein